MKHPHAELMLQYAQDAMETDKPWERWELRPSGDKNWMVPHFHPQFHVDYEYRRKPRTININGFEVPEPMREAPKVGSSYFVIDTSLSAPLEITWRHDEADKKWLSFGICHATKEAAEIHRKALLSFTCPQQPFEIC